MDFSLHPDIDTLAISERGVAVPILSLQSGLPLELEGVAVTITVKGSDSVAFQEAQLEMERTRNKVLGAGGKFSQNEAMAELLAGVTLSWTGMLDKAGVAAQCNAANAKTLYLAAPAIRDQVLARVTNRANFTRASSTS